MAYMYLESIVCNDQNEISEDEPYILINGVKVWEGDMSQGEGITFQSENPADSNYVDPFPFAKTATVKLFEDDGNHWWDKNDFLGEKKAYSWQAGDENLSMTFTGDDANYTLQFAIA